MKKNKLFLALAIACALLAAPCYYLYGVWGVMHALITSSAWVVRYAID